MKLLFDFFPIIIFFIVYKLYGLYTATAVLIGVVVLQTLYCYFRHKKVGNMQWVILVLAILLGGATLIFHDPMFIKWKPTAVYWLMSIVFLGSQFIGEKNLMQRMMDKQINLPDNVWTHVNVYWVVVFALLGALNVYVIYHFDTNDWVNFKLFGILILTFVFVVIQAIYLARHIREDDSDDK